MMSTSPGTAIEGISETAMSPIAARSGIRAVSTTWSTMIVSRPVPPTIRSERARLASRGAAPLAISSPASASSPGSARNVSGVGITHSSAVSRRNTSIMNTTQTDASMRLTATAGRRYRRAMKPAASTATDSTIAPSSQLLGRTTRMSGRSAANTAASTPIVRVRSAPRRPGRSSEDMTDPRPAAPDQAAARSPSGSIAAACQPTSAARSRESPTGLTASSIASVLWWATAAIVSASAGSNRPTIRTTGPVITPANTRTSLPR